PLWGKDNESWNLTPWDVIEMVPGSRSQRKRVMNVDMKYPILVLKKNGKWLIVDGVHRLVRAYINGQKTIPAKIVTEGLIERYPWTKESKTI
ncbi:MAG: ParB N-terminal domain-containing protein, partial [Patescibacteria group bacterium]|nr:ParB N-terminal domain-containing protein [Patescibacteria group bacterium]